MVKQVIVMRKDLKMRRGKEIAQAAHASLKIFFDRMSRMFPNAKGHGGYKISMTPSMEEWKDGHFTKICVYVNSDEELLEIVKQAEEAGLPVALITDRGLTEFNGVHTNTCCAIGPDYADKINEITGNLPLY